MGTTDKEEATELALEWFRVERDACKGRLCAAKARELIAETYERHCGENLQQETVRTWSELWLENKAPSLTPRSLARYKGIVEHFLTISGDKADLPIEHYAVQHAQTYRKHLLSTGKSNHSVNLDFKVIRSMFRAANRSNLIRSNPLEAIESLPNDTQSHVPFTLQQVADLVATARGDWRLLVILGFTTGARLGDVAMLSWSNVDWEKRLLLFRQTKTKRHLKSRDLVLPIHPMLERELESIGAPRKKGFLMPGIAEVFEKHGTGGRQGLSRLFLELMDEAGIAQPEGQGKVSAASKAGRKGARKRPLLSFHSFRHTLASVLHNAGVAPEIRQKITGHASASVHQIYTHTDVDTLRQALLRLPDPAASIDKAG